MALVSLACDDDVDDLAASLSIEAELPGEDGFDAEVLVKEMEERSLQSICEPMVECIEDEGGALGSPSDFDVRDCKEQFRTQEQTLEQQARRFYDVSTSDQKRCVKASLERIACQDDAPCDHHLQHLRGPQDDEQWCVDEELAMMNACDFVVERAE